ncbi:MAG: dihydroorotase, partial [Methyloprofundus sp.]|nr:dihydroorotase [Methyloprofundus sp.]
MSNIKITGGRIIDPANQIDQIGDLFISGSKIVSVLTQPNGFSADLIINAEGQIVCPGFIDLCARLRDPGQTHKANIASETKAAASAGITTLCNPPDTLPVTDTSAVTELILDKARSIGKAQVLPIGALTSKLEGKILSNMSSLNKAGCIAFSNARHPIKNTLVIRRAMEYAATHELLVIIPPEDP